jgi:hypothetical protein
LNLYDTDQRFKSNSLFDGLTGSITDDRQYSLIKTTLTRFYPLIKIGLSSFGSFANLLFVFTIVSDLSLFVALSISLIIAPCVGFYGYVHIRNYIKETEQKHRTWC